MDMMMGDNTKSTGEAVHFRVQLSGNTVVSGETYTVNVIKNGGAFQTFNMNGSKAVVEFTDTPTTSGRTYYRVTVEGPSTAYPGVPKAAEVSGNMVGLSNPIYFNFDPNF